MRASAAPSKSTTGKNASSKKVSAKGASSSDGTAAVFDKSVGSFSIPSNNIYSATYSEDRTANSNIQVLPQRMSTRNSPASNGKLQLDIVVTTNNTDKESRKMANNSDEEESVGDVVEDFINVWQLANPKWTRSEEEEMEMCILGENREHIQIIVYDDANKKWTTDLAKRIKNVELPNNFTVTSTDYPEYVKLYTVNSANYYRNDNEIFPIKNVEGVFVLCGCGRKQCKTNVAAVGHYCGYCATPIYTFCLVEPGSFGCCRKCFLENVLKEEDRHLVKNKTPSRRRQMYIPRTVVAVAPTPSELGREFIDEDFDFDEEEAIAADMTGKYYNYRIYMLYLK